MSNESSTALLNLPITPLTSQEQATPGVIECYCAFCNRLIAASREKLVVDIARRKHVCIEPQVKI